MYSQDFLIAMGLTDGSISIRLGFSSKFYSGIWPSQLVGLLSLRLVGPSYTRIETPIYGCAIDGTNRKLTMARPVCFDQCQGYAGALQVS